VFLLRFLSLRTVKPFYLQREYKALQYTSAKNAYAADMLQKKIAKAKRNLNAATAVSRHALTIMR
jgi:hypothetical protein